MTSGSEPAAGADTVGGAGRSGPTTTVLIVDDQPLFRNAAAALVRSISGLTLVGEAESGEQAVDLADLLHPRLVLMDVRLPGIDGVEATRRILARRPDTRIVLISTYEVQDLPSDYATCGAQAFLRKQDLAEGSLLTAADLG